MKSLRNYLFILLPMLALALFSCKNHATGTFTGSDKQPLNITIAQNEMIKFTKTTGSNRTIVADPFKSHDPNNGTALLDFYLWGTAQSGQVLNPKLVTVTSEDGVIGKVVLDIDCYNWSLTLAACDKNDLPENATITEILAKAVLIGYGNVDMMFTNSIKFTLTPKGLNKTGNVDLTLALAKIDADGDESTPEVPWTIPEDYEVNAYIYDITTGQKIMSADTTPLDVFMEIDPDELTAGTAVFDAKSKDLKPGTYSFQIEFTKEDENRKYVWNDTLIILPGKTVEQTITIPNLVGTKPAAPSSFNVQFNKHQKDGTTLEDEKEESKFPGYYTAHLSWDGSGVKTEMNFALQIAELKDDTAVAAAITTKAAFDAIWDDATKVNAKYTFDYLNDIRADPRFYRDGSLFANNTWVDIYLELGKRYIARLFSENNAGYSEEAAYFTITTPVETGAQLTTINRFRVKYWNQGGIWNIGETIGTEKDNTSNPGYNLPKIEYWSQNINASPNEMPYVVLNPTKGTDSNPNSATAPYLYSGAADWRYWVTDLTSDKKYVWPEDASVTDPYTATAYGGFKNLDLYAVYGREADFVIYNDKDYDIAASYVTAFGLTAPTSTGTNTVSKATLGFDADHQDAKATVTLKLPTVSGTTWVYDKVTFEISYSGITYFNETQTGGTRGSEATDGNKFEIPLKQLPTGYTYNCKLTAQYQMTTISYPFWITLTD